ncbi:MAG: RHS repeat domain-containing protein, partial [Pirellulaceae bacterium]
GAVAERYAYTAYGQPTILNAAGTPLSPQTSTLNSRYSYTGREWDATLGLHHFRARWMSPNAGRFLGKDPMGYLDSDKIIDSSDVNSLLEFHQELYGFLRFNPLEGNDPSGLWELRCRRLAGWGYLTGQVHCWIECEGRSYSLLNNGGTATPVINDPRDKGKGYLVRSGSGKYSCISQVFQQNSSTFVYDKDDCNSNYFANRLLRCCDVGQPRPDYAWGWGNCHRGSGKVYCVPPPCAPKDSGVVILPWDVR